MSAATILTLANGRGIDLLYPKVSDVHWPSYAEALAKENRYNGHTPWRDLMNGAVHPEPEAYADVQPLAERIRPLPDWSAVRSRLLHDWRSLLPNLGGTL